MMMMKGKQSKCLSPTPSLMERKKEKEVQAKMGFLLFSGCFALPSQSLSLFFFLFLRKTLDLVSCFWKSEEQGKVKT